MTIGTFVWSGVTRYRCPVCLWDGSSEAEARLHINDRHVAELLQAEAERLTPQAELYGADDKLITRMPGADPILAELQKLTEEEENNGPSNLSAD